LVTPGPPVQGGQKSRPNRCGSGGGLRRPHCKLQHNAQLAPRRTSLLPYGTTRVELVKVFVGRTLASTTPHALTARVSRTNEVTPCDVTGMLGSTLCRTEFRLELFPFWLAMHTACPSEDPFEGHTDFRVHDACQSASIPCSSAGNLRRRGPPGRAGGGGRGRRRRQFRRSCRQ